MKSYVTKILVLIWVIGLLCSAPLYAQVAGATLTGTITDAQGGAVANAKVSVKNSATGIVTDTTTNSTGNYNLVNLKPADYEVSVSSTGFNTSTTKVTLTVGAIQELSLSLKIGDTSTLVEVTGAAPVIETENATLAGNIQSAQIVELPLNGRDWASLAVLEPGVVAVRPHELVTQPGGNLRGLGNQMTIDGNRPTQNVYRLNGVIVNDYSNAGPGNVLGASLGVDAIQEFSVLTANYSAEYGFTSGGVINAITKSGTNQFHGSAYEFFRNKVFDSNTYLTPDAKPPFVRNQFGGSGGGPIIKNKLFVFADYEGIRQRKGIPVTAKVLSANARLGILSGVPAGTVGCGFPNSTLLSPQAFGCVNNFIEKYINDLTPLPNNGLIGTGDTGKFVTAGDQAVNDDYGTARVDWKISDKDSIDASVYRDYSNWAKPGTFDFETTGYILPNMSAALEENHIFSPAMVNSARFGWTQSIVKNPGLSVLNPELVDTSLGITTAYNAPGLGGQGGSTGVSGITDAGGFSPQGGFSDWVQNYQFFDDVSRTIGKHTVKFGFEFIRNHTDLVNGNGNGSAGFGSVQNFLLNEPNTVRMPTTPPWTAGNTKHYNRNSVFGAYVQDDWKMRNNLTINVGLRYEMSTIPFEKNGKFILLPTLWADPGNCTEDINGLPQSDCSGLKNKVFDSNPTVRNFEPRVGFAWDPFNSGKTSVRGGFGIFDVLPMPFMFGLNALQASPSGAELDMNNPTTCPTPNTTSTSSCPLTQGAFAQGLPGDVTASGITAAGSGRWQYTDRNPKRNYVMQWNLNVQRQITPNSSLTLAYAGSRGIHNPFQTDTLNTCFPTKTPAGWLFPDPEFNTSSFSSCPGITSPAPTGIVPNTIVNPFVPGLLLSTAFFSESTYNSFQANFVKKISHGLQAEVSFTWQKSFDNSSGSFAGDNYSSNPTAATPWWDGSITRGLSDFNITRNLSINWLYQVPTPKAFAGPAGWVARGWSVGGLLDLSDGVPMWPLGGLNSDPLGQANSEPMDIPDLAPGCTAKNAVQPGNLQYLKPSCFIYPVAPNQAFWNANCNQSTFGPNGPTGTPASFGLDPLTCTNLLGHLGRNSIIGPGLFNVDMSFIKDNHISKFGENFNIQFRAELFNIFNRANYPPPTDNLDVLDPQLVNGFGQIDQDTQVPMREIQFALKIVF
ncbi:MAG TPA: carboxypeptidase regulatory-like domain-containing protein [Candidatus Acidoferrum sp.]|jgi:hypothetical protein|nr:carboxypeptidase regulatory-like domain-containing protein [Candidatus Acidoferrum sp.]